MSSKICCNLQVLLWMETKCGNQTLHGKCYLCTKPGCSGAANNGDSELFSIDGINNFSVRLSFITRKLYTAAVLSQDRDRPSMEGATLSLCKYASELAGYGVVKVRSTV